MDDQIVSAASEVYLVKADRPARQSLAAALAAAGFASRTFDTGEAFLAVCERLPPGCVITGFQAPDMDVLEFLRRMRAEPCPLPVIVVANAGEVVCAVDAMKAGAETVFERPYDVDLLLNAVREALQLNAAAAGDCAQRRTLGRLTHREQEVMGLLVDGETNKMAARRLGISPRTVEVHRASLMRKTGVSSVAELIRLAVAATADGHWKAALGARPWKGDPTPA